MRSLPAPSESRRRSSNEPLGARVVLVVDTTTRPLRRRTTFQRTPLRFWSTSNSVSRRLSSRPTFSLAGGPLAHGPVGRATAPPPCLGPGGGGGPPPAGAAGAEGGG